MASAGFEIEGPFATDGISYLMKDFDDGRKDEGHREFLLEIIAKIK